MARIARLALTHRRLLVTLGVIVTGFALVFRSNLSSWIDTMLVLLDIVAALILIVGGIQRLRNPTSHPDALTERPRSGADELARASNELTPNQGIDAGDAASLSALSAALTAATNPEAVANAIAVCAAKAVGADVANVAIPEPGTSEYYLIHSTKTAIAKELLWPKIDMDSATPTAECLRSGTPVMLVSQEQFKSAYPCLADSITKSGVEATAWVPMLGRDHSVIGALGLAWYSVCNFDSVYTARILSVSSMCSQALERATLYRVERTQREFFEQARDDLLAITDIQTREGMKEAILSQGSQILKASANAMFHIEGQNLVLDTYSGYPTEAVGGWVGLDLSADAAPADAAHSGRIIVVGDEVSEDQDWKLKYSTLAGLHMLMDAKASAIVPLRFGAEIAVACFTITEADGYTRTALAKIPLLAQQWSRALDRVRFIERERQIAHELQMAMIGNVEYVAGLECEALYWASDDSLEVGGDWYDVKCLPDGRAGLVVGDIVGHSLKAATTMGQVKSAMQALAGVCQNPGQMLREMDRFALALPEARLATALYAILDPFSGELEYSCAGHPPPLVVHDDGSFFFLTEGRRPPLGLTPDSGTEYQQPQLSTQSSQDVATAILPWGSTLVLYTDGLVERREHPIDRGMHQLAMIATRLAVSSGDGPLRSWCDELVSTMFDGLVATDDVAVIVARLRSSYDVFRRELPNDMAALEPLRSDLRHWLSRYPLSEADINDVLLATGESLVNSVEHAYRHVEPGSAAVQMMLEWNAPNQLVIRVRDFGIWREPTSEKHRGHGLRLLQALGDSFQLHRSEQGTTVIVKKSFELQ